MVRRAQESLPNWQGQRKAIRSTGWNKVRRTLNNYWKRWEITDPGVNLGACRDHSIEIEEARRVTTDQEKGKILNLTREAYSTRAKIATADTSTTIKARWVSLIISESKCDRRDLIANIQAHIRPVREVKIRTKPIKRYNNNKLTSKSSCISRFSKLRCWWIFRHSSWKQGVLK